MIHCGFISHVISRTTGPNIGLNLFVLISMHFPYCIEFSTRHFLDEQMWRKLKPRRIENLWSGHSDCRFESNMFFTRLRCARYGHYKKETAAREAIQISA